MAHDKKKGAPDPCPLFLTSWPMLNSLDGQSNHLGTSTGPQVLRSWGRASGTEGLAASRAVVRPAEWVGLAILRLSRQDVPSQERSHIQLPPSEMGWGAVISKKILGCRQSKLKVVVLTETKPCCPGSPDLIISISQTPSPPILSQFS